MMRNFGGDTSLFSRYVTDPVGTVVQPVMPQYEILFDDTGVLADVDRMIMRPVACSETYLEFYALVPDDDMDSCCLFSLNQTGNPRFLFKFHPSNNVMQMQGKTDGGVTIDEDTVAYTQFGVYAKIKIDFSGASLRLYLNDVLFHTFAHGDSITPSLFTSNIIGASDNSGNQAMRLGSKVKGITGIFGQSLAFNDDLHNELCENGETAAWIFDNKNGGLWSQPVATRRLVVQIL